MGKISKHNQLRLFLLGFGLFIGLCGWSMFGQGKKSVKGIDQWANVEAVIIESRMESVSFHNPSNSGPGNLSGWKPAITYKYNFSGSEYKNTRYTIMPSESTDYDNIKSIVNSYPVGSNTIIYVNPENPSESVLSRSDRAPSKILFITGVILIITGLALVVAAAIVRDHG